MSSFTTSRSSHDEAPSTIPFNRLSAGPDVLGRFGSFGGRFVPETLMKRAQPARLCL